MTHPKELVKYILELVLFYYPELSSVSVMGMNFDAKREVLRRLSSLQADNRLDFVLSKIYKVLDTYYKHGVDR